MVLDSGNQVEVREAVGFAGGSGVAVIRRAVKTLSTHPGVYRMLNSKGEVLYVGKAKNLRKRVSSYTRVPGQDGRIAKMIGETAGLEIIITQTEAEALLLEANLIKKWRPRYNVVLRDDKSHPYILLPADHNWPRLEKHRGSRNRDGQYFGPFASAGAVNRTLNALQRAFPLRTCSDSIFKGRTRPCLQYQIKRCVAPCVDYVSLKDYNQMVEETRQFLSGESDKVGRDLAERMHAASQQLEFETAAVLRDRIRALAYIQSHQGINVQSIGDADVIAAEQQGGQTCVQVFFFRGGSNFGNRAYFLTHHKSLEITDILSSFIVQFYEAREAPRLLLLSHKIENPSIMKEALSLRSVGRVTIEAPLRGQKRDIVLRAVDNARAALGRRLSESASQNKLLEGLGAMVGLEGSPKRVEIYDNSHISGANSVGAMVVAGPEGFRKSAYRKFNIKPGSESRRGARFRNGDDYAMMRQVLTRRFTRLLNEDPYGDEGTWPDLVLVDGGPGQVSSACKVFDDLGIGRVPVAGVAKGPERDAGGERLYFPDKNPIMLPPNDPVSYFIQRLRDEAHRFAIGSHRTRRSKEIRYSELDEIVGIGAKRKRAILNRFGSVRAVANAGLSDLEEVEGVSAMTARRIYDFFHAD
ncbi:MAG: excinuclease ABC subunit UvrC [Pseudomonadota bacterium]|nr:excinuclease ABC subunit UvrC [Pseudomonadota bacterium]